MRYWVMSLALAFFIVAVGDSQETKKKDTGKGKDSKATPTEITEYQGRSFTEWWTAA